MPTAPQPAGSTPFQKILILGSPGAGKSTLARELMTPTGLPLVHLDKLYWLPGWVEPETNAWLERLDAELANPAWIMDGNYSRTLQRRLPYADAVIVLDYPTPLCLLRAAKRIFTTRGRVRADMSEGCPERMDIQFLLYVSGFRTLLRPQLMAALATFHKPKLILTSPRQRTQIAAFLSGRNSQGETL